MRTLSNPGPHYDTNATMEIGDIWTSLLTLTRKSFHILFPAKGVVCYSKIISSRLYVLLKKLVHLMVKHFQTPVNKLNNLNYNPIAKKHRGPRVWDSGLKADVGKVTVSLVSTEVFLWLTHEKLDYPENCWCNFRNWGGNCPHHPPSGYVPSCMWFTVIARIL